MSTIEKKKEILMFIVRTRRIKSRDIVFFLKYLAQQPHLLEKLKFVENAKNAPRGIVLSDKALRGPQLKYYRNKIETTITEILFDDMKNNPDEEWFMQVDFEGIYSNKDFLSLLEDISFSTESSRLTKEESKELDTILEHAIVLGKEYRLKEAINKALDNKDENLFIELTNQLSDHKKEQIT